MKHILRFFMAFCCIAFLQFCQKNIGGTQNPPVVPPPFKILDSAQMVSDMQQLSADSFKGRKSDYAEIALTHDLIQKRLRQAALDSFATGYFQNFTLLPNPTQHKNLIGFIKGTEKPNEYIVMGAHYDHVGVRTSDGNVYNGADDNASGVAAVLAAAKYFKANPPKHSIIFALWAAEEIGLQGSKYFTNNLPAGLTLAQIKFNLNLDMIARSDNNKIWGCGLYHYPAYAYLIDSLQGKTNVQLFSGFDSPSSPQNWTNLSDQGSFHAKGIPFLYLGVEDHADYHKVTDEFNKISLTKYVENANIAAQMMLLLDRKIN
ncbi:MAG TPA: M20/M25/M40 family metallo-hydrolase [Ferruginibacter sp.]|nr:M20/M25/M40 family metallo-hydrolase [Ferruginibacter sp.]HRE64657.1 M20/M25/M40 family metallo-hydrolase [Ferruginibacter sp.]